jgi:flavin-dependent dehydrogenase
MEEPLKYADSHVLGDGARIAVIGGGPTGSFFSIFALKMARLVEKNLHVTIYEPKDFTRDGPQGCNRCGGIVSELLVQMLAVEGINLPDSVVQRGINSYRLHTNKGSAFIATPALEKRIATVYRGGGPKGIIGREKESFDNFLLQEAVKEGAVHVTSKVDRVEYRGGRPVLYAGGSEVAEADLVVGAFGVNSQATGVFEDAGFGYKKPATVATAIAEVGLDRSVIESRFGDSVHLFLLPIKNIKFAALIPKQTYLTVCILGTDINARIVEDFLAHPVVRGVLPGDFFDKPHCRCMPRMNTGAPRVAFADRIVACGDAGSTRLFKDGIGAAYLMGKAAAKTAVFHGVSRAHFERNYYPVYRSIIVDNLFGKILYRTTDFYRNHEWLTRVMLDVVEAEQGNPGDTRKVLSSILWDMFTGNERYKSIFLRTLSARMHLMQLKSLAGVLVRRGSYG